MSEDYSVIISLGSNTENREENIGEAIMRVCSLLESAVASAPYLTEPLSGMGAQYLNAVIRGYTSQSYESLGHVFKQMEKDMGRDEECRKTGKVPIDIDIVVYDGEVVRVRDYNSDFFMRGLKALEC